MSTFAERFDAFYRVRCDYSIYLEAKGYYQDNGVTRWEPTYPEDVEPEKPFGPGAMTVGELDDYDCCSDCEELYQDNDEPGLFYEELDELEEF